MLISKRLATILKWTVRTAVGVFVAVLFFPFLQKILEDAGGYGAPKTRLSYAQDVVASVLSEPRVAWVAGLALGISGALAWVEWLLTHEKIERSHHRLPVQRPSEIEAAIQPASILVTPRTRERPAGISLEDARSALSESYYFLRTLLIRNCKGPPRRVLVTSSTQGEGKTTTSLALAKSFAQIGLRTLLVDADTRKPTYRVSDSPAGGLLQLADGQEPERFIHDTVHENLFLLPTGGIAPFPTNLLWKLEASKLWDRLLPSFDVIIVDAPPALGMADAAILATTADHVVFVMEANKTMLEAAAAALKSLGRDSNDVTLLLTKVDAKTFGGRTEFAFYGYGYGYGAGYGYQYGNGNPGGDSQSS